MSDAFPPSTSGSNVRATAPIVRYPPEYFAFGAAGFHHVSTVLNDLALAASSIQAAPPPAKRRRGAPSPHSSMRDSRGHSTWKALIVCLYHLLDVSFTDRSLTRIAYLLHPKSASRRHILVVAMGPMWASGQPGVSTSSLRPTRVTSRTKTSNTSPSASALPAQRIWAAKTSTSRTDKIEDRTQSLILLFPFISEGSGLTSMVKKAGTLTRARHIARSAKERTRSRSQSRQTVLQ
jgi:hypothetical protein